MGRETGCLKTDRGFEILAPPSNTVFRIYVRTTGWSAKDLDRSKGYAWECILGNNGYIGKTHQ